MCGEAVGFHAWTVESFHTFFWFSVRLLKAIFFVEDAPIDLFRLAFGTKYLPKFRAGGMHQCGLTLSSIRLNRV